VTSPQPEWTIRPGTPDDTDAVQELFRVVFGYDRGRGHHAWKFGANPAGPPVLALAEHSGQVVGQYALWPTRLRIGKDVLLGAQSLDTMTHPDFRGQGMFTRLARECMAYAEERGVDVLFGFPNAASYPGFVRKLDWDHVGDVPQYVRILRPSGHDRVPTWAGPVLDATARLIPSGRRRGATASESPPDPLLVERLSTQLQRSGECAVDRSASYLEWRFAPESGRRYTWVADREGEAVAIWGRDSNSGRAYLAELVGRSPSSSAAVLAETIRMASDAGCTELVATASQGEGPALLRRAGFLRRASLPLIVRKLTTRVLPGNVHDFRSWSIFGADLDTY
jgi:predicted N-acetyltransferase YhbS